MRLRLPAPVDALILSCALLLGAAPASAQSDGGGLGIDGLRGTVYALSNNNVVFTFEPGAPGKILWGARVTGLQAGETLVGIDFRPSTGDLVGLGSSSRLYRIHPDTGAATPVGGPFTPALAGSSFGVDFNPVVDRIRVVSDAGQNLRLHPDTAAVVGTDSILAYASGDPNFGLDPNLVGSAYTNNFPGASSTTLYGIDSGLDVLVTQGSAGGSPVSPNTGMLFTVGGLGLDASDLGGFDISMFGGALAVFSSAATGTSSLYSINLGTGAATLLGAIGVSKPVIDIAIRPPSAPLAYGLTTGNNLVSFRPGTPGTLLGTVAISGLQPGESLLGIDFRPATGELYGLGSSSRVYWIDENSGAALAIGASPFSPAFSGIEAGFDFNPIVDRIRAVGDSDQNLRLHPDTGAVVGTDTPLAYAAGDAGFGMNPNVVGSAYTVNFPGSSGTTLYGIDSVQGVLVTQGSVGGAPTSPNLGTLFTVGALGPQTSDLVGFDITAAGGAFASLTDQGASTSKLYTINLGTGLATLVGAVGGSEPLRGLAIRPPSTPLVAGLTSGNRLVYFSPGMPGTIVKSLAVTGLQPGEALLGIDFRPSTGDLLALGNSSRLYRVNSSTGAAVPIGTGPFSPALAGTEFGVDFNPVVDRVRVVSDIGQNLRLHPDTGAVVGTDTMLAYDAADPNFGVAPMLAASAYSANFVATTSTTLYGLDAGLDVLVRQGSIGGSPVSPNTGTLFTVGALGVDTSAVAGFDLSPYGGALAVLTTSGGTLSQLYSINLNSGAATLLGTVGGADRIRDIALLPAKF